MEKSVERFAMNFEQAFRGVPRLAVSPSGQAGQHSPHPLAMHTMFTEPIF
jgi:hypothetical protein